MTDQEIGGAPAPVTDAPASPPVTTGSEAAPSPAATNPGDKPAKPPKSGEQIRIDELTRRLREEQRRNERLLKLAEERGQPPPPQQQPPKSKTLADYNYDEAAFRADTHREALAQVQGQIPNASQLYEQFKKHLDVESRRTKFQERAAKFASDHPDYEEIVDPGPDPERNARWACSPHMAEVIEESEEGPAIQYYLAQNPEIAAQLSRLGAVQASRELTRLEDRLVSERKKAAEKPVSQAPAPPPKIDGSDPGNITKNPAEMTDAEFSKWFRKRRNR